MMWLTTSSESLEPELLWQHHLLRRSEFVSIASSKRRRKYKVTYPEDEIEDEHHILQAAEAASCHVALLKF